MSAKVAKPDGSSVVRSITNPTEFAVCKNCGATITRDFVGQAGETYWYHRYVPGHPTVCKVR
jgi:hypothetical protein